MGLRDRRRLERTTTFKYDPLGRRIEKISPTTTSIFVYDGENLVETTNGSGSEVAGYTQTENIDEPLAMDRSGTVDYYEQDGLGSITSLTASTASVAQSYAYDSFGNTTNSTGSLTNFFRYTGREFDTETGLYFLRARYYDPTVGKFLSEDPLTFDTSPNFYSYVGNEPVGFSNPSGLQPQQHQGPPVYNPGPWNNPGNPPGTGTQYQNNCYSYACNRLYPPGQRPHAPQPGEASGKQWSKLTCKNVIAAAVRDGLKNDPNNACCPDGYHKILLFIGSNVHAPAGPNLGPDYHWYRQDSDGMWSSKHGLTPVGPQVSDRTRTLILGDTPHRAVRCVHPTHGELI